MNGLSTEKLRLGSGILSVSGEDLYLNDKLIRISGNSEITGSIISGINIQAETLIIKNLLISNSIIYTGNSFSANLFSGGNFLGNEFTGKNFEGNTFKATQYFSGVNFYSNIFSGNNITGKNSIISSGITGNVFYTKTLVANEIDFKNLRANIFSGGYLNSNNGILDVSGIYANNLIGLANQTNDISYEDPQDLDSQGVTINVYGSPMGGYFSLYKLGKISVNSDEPFLKIKWIGSNHLNVNSPITNKSSAILFARNAQAAEITGMEAYYNNGCIEIWSQRLENLGIDAGSYLFWNYVFFGGTEGRYE